MSCWQALVAERGNDGAQGCGANALAGELKLGLGEFVLLGVFLEIGADHLERDTLGGADGIEQLLAPHASPVAQDDGGALGRVLQIEQSVFEEVV
jgi:hypothetical protein